MRIADVMTRDVRVIQPDRTVREAARLMDEMNVGVLPVCDGRRLVGMITDRDITVRSTAAGLAPDQSYVRDVMTDDVEWCFEDDDVDEIVEIMSRHQIRRSAQYLPALIAGEFGHHLGATFGISQRLFNIARIRFGNRIDDGIIERVLDFDLVGLINPTAF